jgi:hypothetical protein
MTWECLFRRRSNEDTTKHTKAGIATDAEQMQSKLEEDGGDAEKPQDRRRAESRAGKKAREETQSRRGANSRPVEKARENTETQRRHRTDAEQNLEPAKKAREKTQEQTRRKTQ